MGHFKWIRTYICGVPVIMTGCVPYTIRSNAQNKAVDLHISPYTRQEIGYLVLYERRIRNKSLSKGFTES